MIYRPSQKRRAHDIANALYDIVQDERLVARIMRRLAGLQVDFPTAARTEEVLGERLIVRRLRADSSTATVRRLSQSLGLPMRSVAKSYTSASGSGIKSLRAEHATSRE
ncbi:MAG TPA: hypothetical protein VGB55_03700 [Tepidisphaeraceae bacterium]|jgi:hypothetical protein